MKTQWLKPAPDLLVRFEDPSQGHIPAEGAEVPLTKYYRRRVADGDLVKGRPPAPAKPSKEG